MAGKQRKIMKTFKFGLVHAPLTPFIRGGIDYKNYINVLDFHIHHGAQGLGIATHAGESVSLTIDERNKLLQFSISHIDSRVPVIANVSEAGTGIAASLAKTAAESGAQALMASVPYYWTPPESMLLEHFKTIGDSAGGLPFYLYNAPEEMGGAKISTKLVLSLIEELPNFAGVIDKSHDWQYMIELASEGRRAKNGFEFISGSEYMISAGAIGATGLLSQVSSIAPKLIQELYDLCLQEDYKGAYNKQVDAACLYRLFDKTGIPGLKAASKLQGRDLGDPRSPLPPLSNEACEILKNAMDEVPSIRDEKLGWV